MTSDSTRSGFDGSYRRQRRLTVGGGLDPVAGGAQQPLDVVAHVEIVVGQQDETIFSLLRQRRQVLRLGRCRHVGRPASDRRASSTPLAHRPVPGTPPGALSRAACTRSAGRWAVPSGRRTVKVLPTPTSLATEIVPPCRRTSSCTSARPMPLPSMLRPRAPSTRWKRSNRCGSSAAGMPVPVSRTATSTALPSAVGRMAMAISPSKVNFSALDRRLRTIFSHMSRSTWTGAGKRRTIDAQVEARRGRWPSGRSRRARR